MRIAFSGQSSSGAGALHKAMRTTDGKANRPGTKGFITPKAALKVTYYIKRIRDRNKTFPYCFP
jgi:hypothetical protein